MRRLGFLCLLLFDVFATLAVDLSAQDAMPEVTTWRQFNQVFVKVIVPVTPRSPRQEGPVVDSWVAKQLKELGETEYFAVTDWVPVCDAFLEDDAIDNRVWDGNLDGKHFYCPVGGDLPKREMGRVVVNVAGWTPVGGAANITLRDEPGSRAVGPVRLVVGNEGKRDKIEQGLPYVAVMIAPPPLQGITSVGGAK